MKRPLLAAVFAAVACTCAALHAADEEPAWRNVETPVESALRAVWLPDDDTIFACGDNGVVIVSRDAGKTWKIASLPSKAALRGIHFADSKHGWICGDGDPDGPQPKGHVLSSRPMTCGTCLITSDGGSSWKRVWVHTNFELRSIWMASLKVGQICNHGGEGHVDGDRIVTSDGGLTWSGKRVFRGMNDCFWNDEKEGWAVGSGVFGRFVGGPPNMPALMTNQEARIIRTTDGGQEWEPVDAPDIGKGNQLRSLWFSDRKTGCAVGDAGAVIRTEDGGRNWTAAEKAVESRLDAVCIAGSSGWAMGSAGAIIGTSDCGKSWKKEDSPTGKDLFGLHVRGKTAVAVGDRGTVLVRRAK